MIPDPPASRYSNLTVGNAWLARDSIGGVRGVSSWTTDSLLKKNQGLAPFLEPHKNAPLLVGKKVPVPDSFSTGG